MAQFNWTYVNDFGQRYNVGLFHGDRTGHVMVHCNTKVILIDFSVLQSNTYSFFIDEELCELKIERKKDRFWYGFEVNTDADTPRNRERKAVEKKHWKQTLLFFGSLIFCALSFIFLMKFGFSQSSSSTSSSILLPNNSSQTIAKLFIEKEEPEFTTIRCSFVADNRAMEKNIKVASADLSLQNGFPLISGDEFNVQFLNNDPSLFKVQYDQPSDRQIRRYQERTIEKHTQLHSNLSKDQVKCLVNIAYELKGLGGLADFYCQALKQNENPIHNELTFKRLIRDIPFKQKKEERCL